MPTSISESVLEQQFIGRLENLKYTYRDDIRDRTSLHANFREKFESLNHCKLTDKEFDRFLQQIVQPDVFRASRSHRERESFMREDDTPRNFELVNTRDWCKNTFEVINQLRMNTANSFHHYDVVLLLNGIPVVQVELKQLSANPRKALEQIVAYKADAGNGYTNSLLCFLQILVVSNQPTHLISQTTMIATLPSMQKSDSCASTNGPKRTRSRSRTWTTSHSSSWRSAPSVR